MKNIDCSRHKIELGDIVREEIKSKEFGRITTQNARNVILQKIREEERKFCSISIMQKKKTWLPVWYSVILEEMSA